MKCLVVDDSTTTRRAIVRALRPLGWDEIREAGSISDALAAFDGSLDLVVAGWNPPQLDGLDLARQLRARPDGAPARIVLVSAQSEKARVLEAIEAGIDGYFLRPFSPDHLRERIAALVSPAEGSETEARAA